MKISYLVPTSENPKSGIMKKVRGQAGWWREQGHEVDVYVVALASERSRALSAWDAAEVFEFRSGLDRFLTLRRAADRIAESGADVIYGRYHVWYPALPRLGSVAPVVLEINSDDLHEYRVAGSRGRAFVNRVTRRRVLRGCAGLIFVTPELARSPSYSWFPGRTTVVSNGFDLASVEVLPPAPEGARRLVFMGSPGQPWHGLDRLCDLARRAEDWCFDVVGLDDGDLPECPDNVTAYGFLDQAAYERILERAHVAVGTLALDRKGMSEATPLKVREYLAYGLPVIIGYRDVDFPEGAPFLLGLSDPARDVVDRFDDIEQFVSSWVDRRVARSAIGHLEMKRKEAARLAFFESLTEGR